MKSMSAGTNTAIKGKEEQTQYKESIKSMQLFYRFYFKLCKIVHRLLKPTMYSIKVLAILKERCLQQLKNAYIIFTLCCIIYQYTNNSQ